MGFLKNIQLLTICSVFLLPSSVSGADSEIKDDVEIVIGGEKYGSFHQYQLKRLRIQIKEELDQYQGVDLLNYLDSLEKEYLSKKRKKFKAAEIQSIFEDFRELYKKPEIVETTDDMIAEMQEIAKAQNRTKGSSESLEIDPSKVKTWVINADEK